MSLRRGPEEPRRVVSVRLSEAEIAALPDAASPSEGLRLALDRALMFDATVLKLAETAERLAETSAGLGAELSAELASLHARIDELARARDAKNAGVAAPDRSAAPAMIERLEAFQSETYDVVTAAFRHVIAVRAMIEAERERADACNDLSGECRPRSLEEIEDALLRAHWDEFAGVADRIRDAVFGPPGALAAAPPAAVAAAE